MINESFNFAQHVISINEGNVEKLAYIDDQQQISYAELTTYAYRFANALKSLKVQREQRVLLLMHDSIELPIAFLGCLYAGVVPVVVNTLLPSTDYAYMIKHSAAKAVFVSSPIYPTLNKALKEIDGDHIPVVIAGDASDVSEAITFFPLLMKQSDKAERVETHRDEIAFWLYSSGSTGRPKGTVHTQANLYWSVELYGKNTLQIHHSDVVFSAAKLFFAYGLGNSLSFPLCAGATVILMSSRPTAEAVFQKLLEHKVSLFFGAPTLFAAMLASPELPDASKFTLRACVSAGESLPEDLGLRFNEQVGCYILDGIGSTEMLHIYISNSHDDVRYGTTGKPVKGYDVEIRDPNGQLVKAGEIGDLYVRGPSAALMYWANREKSLSTFLGEWTKTGDKFICNSEGYYIYAGRGDDMLKVSGQYVSPVEVEATLISHNAVLESAVVGKPDKEGLTKTHAYVVLQRDYQASDTLVKELQTFVKKRLTPHKYPRFVHFVKVLPKTVTGKIQRFKLRDEVD